MIVFNVYVCDRVFAAAHAWIDPSNLQQYMIARWVIIMSITHLLYSIHVDNMTHYIIHRYMHECMYVCLPTSGSFITQSSARFSLHTDA
jgi:hypothetical protein